MASSIEFDFRKLIEKYDKAAETIALGLRRGLHDVLDEWRAESVDVAPIDTTPAPKRRRKGKRGRASGGGGTLRRSISVGEIVSDGLSISGSISANATEKSRNGRRFNYAYYIHEGFAEKDGKKMRTPGTVADFLDATAKKNEERWQVRIEEEIKEELRKQGW